MNPNFKPSFERIRRWRKEARESPIARKLDPPNDPILYLLCAAFVGSAIVAFLTYSNVFAQISSIAGIAFYILALIVGLLGPKRRWRRSFGKNPKLEIIRMTPLSPSEMIGPSIFGALRRFATSLLILTLTLAVALVTTVGSRGKFGEFRHMLGIALYFGTLGGICFYLYIPMGEAHFWRRVFDGRDFGWAFVSMLALTAFLAIVTAGFCLAFAGGVMTLWARTVGGDFGVIIVGLISVPSFLVICALAAWSKAEHTFLKMEDEIRAPQEE